MATPFEKYQEDLKKSGFTHDLSQEAAVKKLQDLYERLLSRETHQIQENRFKRLATKIARRSKPIEPEMGLYFWGGVGRGKTYLMDTFYESLPFEQKMRVHFHRFMQLVHHELTELKGEKNPLELVADRLKAKAKIICFDEFFVTDIGDAMILGTLLEALFARGVCLVCTSNIIPDGLYKDGLQRQRFLPAIDLLNKYTEVINVDGGADYRLRALEQAELYYSPLSEAATGNMENSYQRLALEDGCHGTALSINGRAMKAIKRSEDVAWFEFKELCDGPRSQNDYIELAREFHAVLVSNIPVLTTDMEDQARRFINLVDEFYDRRVKLIVSAAGAINEIYQGERLRFEFDRTESRLLEMQSHEYLAAAHRA